jgi:hypothetical protein
MISLVVSRLVAGYSEVPLSIYRSTDYSLVGRQAGGSAVLVLRDKGPTVDERPRGGQGLKERDPS